MTVKDTPKCVAYKLLTKSVFQLYFGETHHTYKEVVNIYNGKCL